MTGFHRDGFVKLLLTIQENIQCVRQLTNKFLIFSKELGNDLITPRPEFDFPGLKEGDNWCLCADRWIQAYNINIAPDIYLEATHIAFLKKLHLMK